MELLRWFALHWLDVLQSVGIIAGLGFTAYTIRLDSKAKRISHLISFAQQHRDIWKQTYERPELSRILDFEVDLSVSPVTKDEELFVNLLILHLANVYQAMMLGMFVPIAGLEKDVGKFFSRPIPRSVWKMNKGLHDVDFVEYVESCAPDKQERK